MTIVLTEVGAVEVLELAALPHVAVGALAVVEDRVCDLDGEARGATRAGVGLEGDVGADGTLGRRTRLRGRPGGTCGCKEIERAISLEFSC